MIKIADRRYQRVRIIALILAGVGVIAYSRAKHIDAQSPPVKIKAAPELVGTKWLNTPGPITLASRRGKVTMVEFWTFACSNCQANLAAYERWQKRFAPTGFTIISVHTPELQIERDESKLKSFIASKGITYPVLVDNQNKNWDRWSQEYWPAIYLVDKKGHVRYQWVGELDSMGSGGEQTVANEIQHLISE
jgi:peroxiredoxin